MPWFEVLEEARRLRLAALLHHAVQSIPAFRAMVPPPMAEALRQTARATAARAARLEQACADIVAGATAAGIPVLVLKGPALASLVYPPGSTRPADDVDLLVALSDRQRLAAILYDRGYRNDLRGEEDFWEAGRWYSIDLHTGIVNTTRVPARGALWPVAFEALQGRSQACVLAGTPARTLGPPDTLFHLAVHAVHHHGLAGVFWMVDLLACLRTWPFALDGVDAAPPPVRRSLWYCLEILVSRGEDPVPAVRAALRPRRALPGESWLLTAVRQGNLPETARYAFTLACLPGWKGKARFLGQLLFPGDGVHTEGFGDGGGTSSDWGTHWQGAIHHARKILRTAFFGRKQAPTNPRGSGSPSASGKAHR